MPETPLILTTWSFGMRGHTAAWPALIEGGCSLDAVETVCRTIEADPEVDSVGFGGLPDAAGDVSLDAAIMLSPSQSGSVCHLRQHLHAITVARHVMENTPHLMLAGDGADAFAQSLGLMPSELLSGEAHKRWEQWKESPHVVDQSEDRGYANPPEVHPRPVDDGKGGRLFREDDERRWPHHDTVGSLALDQNGVLAGACSTSGFAFKIPGRVGDSPIIGHGLYVDPDAGAAVTTGAGELIMGVCATFLAVENMRRGDSPQNAITSTLQRIIDTHELHPEHQAAMIALTPDGQWASAALRSGYKTSVRSPSREEVVEPDVVLLPGT